MPVKVFIRGALAAVLIVVGLALVAPTAAQAATVRVMPLGDSITGSPGCWRAYLWRQVQAAGRTDVDMVGTLNNSDDCGTRYDGDNEGHGGFTVTDVASNGSFRTWMNADRPDIILMHFGTNDVWGNRPTATITAAYSQIVDQARAVNPRVKFIVAKILPVAPSGCSGCPGQTVALNNAIPGWVSSKSTAASPITVVDQWTGWDPASLTIDGVHPNDAGHRRMASVWYPALMSALNGAGTAPNGYPYCANGSGSDPDGDGWGWENNASCIVRGSAADPTGTASNGYPHCANGSGSDPDGDGWGWENNASCVVRGSAADPDRATSSRTRSTSVP